MYKIKYKADSIVERFKARMDVKRYTQQAGIDNNETFCHVVKMTTFRTLITFDVRRGWSLYQLHVNNIFIHGDLNEEVYMKLPEGLAVDSPNVVCKLKKSLYGLKLASRQWYDKLASNLCSKGYTHSDSDYSLFHRRNGSSLVLVAIYVDDVILTRIDKKNQLFEILFT